MFADRNLAESYWSARPGRDYADTVSRLWPEFGETYFELGKVKAVFAGPGMPLTQVNGFGLFGEQTQEDLDAIRRFYEGRAESYEMVMTPFCHPNAWNLLFENGAKLDHVETVLFRTPENPPVVRCDARIVEVTEDLADWTRVSRKGNCGDNDSELVRNLARLMTEAGRSSRFLATMDGVPAGAGAIFGNEKASFLVGGATLPEFRCRGIQQALIAARLAAMPPTMEVVFIETSPGSTSQRNAERMGFKVCFNAASVMVPVSP